jgi:hypothetical protein
MGSNEFDQGRSKDLGGIALECCILADAYAIELIEVSGSSLISLPKALCKSAFVSNPSCV